MEIASSTGFEGFTQLADRAQLSREEFMNVLLLQLQTQNPLEPMDDEKMVNQLVQLQQMDNNSKLTQSMEQMSARFGLMQFQTEFTSAASFIGKRVKGEDLFGEDVEGKVVRVSVEGERGVVTWVDTGEGEPVAVPFNSILEVLAEETEE